MLQYSIDMNIDHFINVLFKATSVNRNELFGYYKIRFLVIESVSSPTLTLTLTITCLFEVILDVLLSHFRTIKLNVNIYI